MAGQVGMGGMGRQMGPQMGQPQQGLTPWGQMSSAMGGPQMGSPQMGGPQAGGPAGYSPGPMTDMHQQLAAQLGISGGGPQPPQGGPQGMISSGAFYGPRNQQQPQAQMGALGGMPGGCPPWMPGCQGGGGGYGGGYAASMPMYGGSRPTLQAQLPAAPRPASPPSSTSLNDGSWMR